MDESLQVFKSVIQKGWAEHKNDKPTIISSYFNMCDKNFNSFGFSFVSFFLPLSLIYCYDPPTLRFLYKFSIVNS